jgi:hypothetical protein
MKTKALLAPLTLAGLLLAPALEAACPPGTIHCCSTSPPICRWPCTRPCMSTGPATPAPAPTQAHLAQLFDRLFEPVPPAAGDDPAPVPTARQDVAGGH